MESLVPQEKREKQVCWGHIRAQEGALVLQEPKETGAPQAYQAPWAGKGQWEMPGHGDPLA